MDIQTKIIFTLVGVALASMFVFGAVMTNDVEGRLRTETLEQLADLAESKREALSWIVSGWQDRTALLASRTQLRASLAEYNRTGSQASLARMRRIVEDAVEGSQTLSLVRIHDVEGRPVLSTTGVALPLPSDAPGVSPVAGQRPAYLGVEFTGAGEPQVSFVATLMLEEERIGTLLAVFVAEELIELTGHFHGLGETGEVILVAEDESGAYRTLHPTRHDRGGVGTPMPSGPGSLSALALGAVEGVFFERTVDYRGEDVWAATQPVPETGWGLIVKVDAEEQARPIMEFRSTMRRNAVILSAFAILAGFVFGLRFAQPIVGLAEVANQVRQGDMTARATVAREDEVGLLARTFNEMASELEDQMALLSEYRKFFDVSVDPMCMAGTDGYFKRVNRAFETELGYTEAELLGRPFFDFVHPDDISKTEREVEKLGQGIPTIRFVNRYLCADGRYKTLRWAAFPEADTGRIYAVAHVVEESGGAT